MVLSSVFILLLFSFSLVSSSRDFLPVLNRKSKRENWSNRKDRSNTRGYFGALRETINNLRGSSPLRANNLLQQRNWFIASITCPICLALQTLLSDVLSGVRVGRHNNKRPLGPCLLAWRVLFLNQPALGTLSHTHTNSREQGPTEPVLPL